MPGHDRQTLLTELRRQVDHAVELRARHLATPGQLQDYRRFTQWQYDYMMQFATEALRAEEHREALEFIVEEMAGAHVVERDDQLGQVAPVMARVLPHRLLDALTAVMTNNTRVLELSLSVMNELKSGVSLRKRIHESDYRAALQQFSSYDEFAGLLQTTMDMGDVAKSAVRSRWVGTALRMMNRPAHAAGFGELQQILERGYRTFRDIPDADEFLAEFRLAMMTAFEHLFHIVPDAGRRN